MYDWDSFLWVKDLTYDYFKKDRVLVPSVVHRCGSDELFVGRAGYLSGALWLNSELKSDIVPQTDLFLICNSIVQSGREYVRRKGSRKQVSNYIDQMGKILLGKLMVFFTIRSIYPNGTNYNKLLLKYGKIYGEN